MESPLEASSDGPESPPPSPGEMGLKDFGFSPTLKSPFQEQTSLEVAQFTPPPIKPLDTFALVEGQQRPAKRPVGRPRKKPAIEGVNGEQLAVVPSGEGLEKPAKRPVGRPRKKPPPANEIVSAEQQENAPVPTGKRPRSYQNWFQPILWTRIERALKLKNFQLRSTVKYLHEKHGGEFTRLNESTMRGWFQEDKKTWTKKVANAIQAMKNTESLKKNPLGRGPTALFLERPELELEFLALVEGIRQAGQVVNSASIQVLLKGFLQSKMPEVLLVNGGTFECSRSWCRSWANKRLHWAFRAPTTNAGDLPKDWEEQVRNMVLRIAYSVGAFKIPPALVVNGDQMGISLMPISGERTYAPKGAREVTVTGQGDKRQISLLVSSSASGDLLPFQCIFAGKTNKVLPCVSTSECLRSQGWHLTFTPNHWSNIISMKEYVSEVIWPWYLSVCNSQNLPVGRQKMVLLLDCFAVHKSPEFRSWLKETYPCVCLIFVPGGCTSIAQPADVVLQRPLKFAIHREFQKWAAAEVASTLEKGELPTNFGLDTGVSNLRNKSVDFLWVAHQYVASKREMIVEGWRKCRILEAWDADKQEAAFEANSLGSLFTSELHQVDQWNENFSNDIDECELEEFDTDNEIDNENENDIDIDNDPEACQDMETFGDAA